MPRSLGSAEPWDGGGDEMDSLFDLLGGSEAGQGKADGGAGVGVGEDALIDLAEVKRLTSFSRSTIYRRMDQDRFPRTVELDGNLARWRRSEIGEWLRSPK